MIDNKPPAIQWYPKDILSSPRVASMSLSEEGAYRRALDFCWLSGSLPSDTKKLAKIIGKKCSIKIAEVVKEMFVEVDGKLLHERQEQEREKQKEFKEKKSIAGKIGNDKRWKKEPQSKQAETKSTKENMDKKEFANFFYIGKEIFKVPVSKYINIEMQIFIDKWRAGKVFTAEEVFKQMDSECIGKQFTNQEHIRNTFNLCYKTMVANKNKGFKNGTDSNPPIATGNYSFNKKPKQ